MDPKNRLAITTDTLIEGIDFELTWSPLAAIGYKALSANLSDLSSMGASPFAFLISLSFPKNLNEKNVESFFDGIKFLSEIEKIELIGGDLGRSPDKLYITITAIGLQRGLPLLRRNAKVNDSIYVTSPLGAPLRALKMFKEGERLKDFELVIKTEEKVGVLERFFRPPSQTKIGKTLSEKGISTCAIDISDGLLKDLNRILKESRKGALLYEWMIPLYKISERKCVSLKEALYGGEEYTLLFTVKEEKESLLCKYNIKAFKIGKIIEEEKIFLQNRKGELKQIQPEGFSHF